THAVRLGEAVDRLERARHREHQSSALFAYPPYYVLWTSCSGYLAFSSCSVTHTTYGQVFSHQLIEKEKRKREEKKERKRKKEREKKEKREKKMKRMRGGAPLHALLQRSYESLCMPMCINQSQSSFACRPARIMSSYEGNHWTPTGIADRM
ncbi:hypothetical protein THAOC_25359, partial [Thalassiosira oceanica]